MKTDKFLIASGFVGPIVFFLSLFIIGLFVEGYNPLTQYISELGAVDSPVKTVANVLGFSLFGIFNILFAIGIYRYKELKLGKLIALFLLLSGISLFLIGVFPCDAGCQNFTETGKLHEKASDYPFIIMTVAFILFAIEFISHEGLRWLTPAIVITGVITLILAYFYLIYSGELPYPGLIQRASIGLPFVTLAIIAYSLFKRIKSS